jgi:hypothetical protein
VKIRAGYDIAFQCSHETPILLMLSVRPKRQADLQTDHHIQLSGIRSRDYLDVEHDRIANAINAAARVPLRCFCGAITDAGSLPSHRSKRVDKGLHEAAKLERRDRNRSGLSPSWCGCRDRGAQRKEVQRGAGQTAPPLLTSGHHLVRCDCIGPMMGDVGQASPDTRGGMT